MSGTVNGTTTLYLGDYFEYLPGDQPTLKKYYYAGGARVAEWDGTKLWYLLQDHLGSTTIAQPADGSPYSEQTYTATGEARFTSGTIPTTITYTGQRAEAALGLMFYNARWFDSALGRFIQADSVIPNPGNPVAFDRYAYCLNNPVNAVDPTGHMPYGTDPLQTQKQLPRANQFLRVAQDVKPSDYAQLMFIGSVYRTGLCGEISMDIVLENATGQRYQFDNIIEHSNDELQNGGTGSTTGSQLGHIFAQSFPEDEWSYTYFGADGVTTYEAGDKNTHQATPYTADWFGPHADPARYKAAIEKLVSAGNYVIAGVACSKENGTLVPYDPTDPNQTGHWVVVEAYNENNDTITIINPFTNSKQTYSWSDFQKAASHYYDIAVIKPSTRHKQMVE